MAFSSAAASAGAGNPDVVERGAVSDSPALGFVPSEYSVLPRARLYKSATPGGSYSPPGTLRHFGRAEVDGRIDLAGGVRFAVEGADEAISRNWQECTDAQPTSCSPIEVGIRADSGKLFMYVPGRSRDQREFSTGEFLSRRLELSAEHASSGLKVYREVNIDPAPEVPDCADYPDMDRDRFACLYLFEQQPRNAGSLITTDELRGALPDLVQPSSEYNLTFSEEFDGTAEPTECGYAIALDTNVWDYFNDPCLNVDHNGVACEYVANGHYRMSFARRDDPGQSKCAARISTAGKFSFKYGYLEVKFSVKLDGGPNFHNLAMVLGIDESEYAPRQLLFGRYGMPLDTTVDYLANTETEVDVFEFLPFINEMMSHQFYNGWGAYRSPQLTPTRTSTKVKLCGRLVGVGISVSEYGLCSQRPRVITVTRGVEWTPRGYRWFDKVHGIDDELSTLPTNKTQIAQKKPDSLDENGNVSSYLPWDEGVVTGSDRDPYFEYLVPGDSNSWLSQIAISHVPLSIIFSTWGSNPWYRVESWVDVDYIRVYQPNDLYSSMDPVYK